MKMGYMDKKTTDAIKGVALIIMFIHHFFAFPEWLVDGGRYLELSTFAKYFCQPTKICVPIFAFLTGFFYFYTKKKTYYYSLKKITDVMISYWAVYAVTLFYAIITGCYQFDFWSVVFELFAIRRVIIVFNWYILFYCSTMLLLPILIKMSKPEQIAPGRDSVVFLVLPVFMGAILSTLFAKTIFEEMLRYTVEWFPCVAMGYLCGKYGLYCISDTLVENVKTGVLRAGIYILLMCLVLVGRYYCSVVNLGCVEIGPFSFNFAYTMDVMYGPIFVYGCAKLLQFIKTYKIMSVLECIGRKSLLMWFVHCVFFNVCKEKTQAILYFPHNPVFVLMLGILLCYSLSALIELVVGFVIKPKNRVLDNLYNKMIKC